MKTMVYFGKMSVVIWAVITITLYAVSAVSVMADTVEIKINEFVSDTGTTQQTEWIELSNPGSVDINLSGWTIEDGTNKPVSLDGKTIAAGGYLLLLKGSDFSFALNNSGDTIILKSGGVVIDSVAYGSWDDGNSADNAPKPGKDKSTGRCPDGSDTNSNNADFIVQNTPSPGASNSCQGGSSGGAGGGVDIGDGNDDGTGAIPAVTGWGMGTAVIGFIVGATVLLRKRKSATKS